jgi:hypothetical protein
MFSSMRYRIVAMAQLYVLIFSLILRVTPSYLSSSLPYEDEECG